MDLLWHWALLLVVTFLPCFRRGFIPYISGSHPAPELCSISWLPLAYSSYVSHLSIFVLGNPTQEPILHDQVFLSAFKYFFFLLRISLLPTAYRPSFCHLPSARTLFATHLFWHPNYCLTSLHHVPHINRFCEFGI